MLRRGACSAALALSGAAAAAPASSGQARGFYDKIRGEREGSDLGPGAMFKDFPQNPNPQQAPQVSPQSNREAVDSAEKLNRAFLASLVVLMGALGYCLDPFNGDQYERPNKFEPVLTPIEKVPPRWAAKE